MAQATELTQGAMTTALDRLERAGYIRRAPDLDDRRAVRVELTDEARRADGMIWGPLADEGFRLLEGYETEELAAIARFLDPPL